MSDAHDNDSGDSEESMLFLFCMNISRYVCLFTFQYQIQDVRRRWKDFNVFQKVFQALLKFVLKYICPH